jgi:hypothetical protein
MAKEKKIQTIARRYCSVKKPEPKALKDDLGGLRTKLIIQQSNKWVNGTTLYYFFFNKKTDGAFVKQDDGSKLWVPWRGSKNQMNAVRHGFRIWEKTGFGLRFKEVQEQDKADIRIAFMKDDGSWSYIGRDILRKRKDPRTMNFGWNVATRYKPNGIDTILHEIGHTLGFPHEHQNPFAGIVWNRKAVYDSLAEEPNCWSEEETFSNIIEKLSKDEVNGSEWDRNSIMHYPFEKGLIKKPKQYLHRALEPVGGLSKRDIKYALGFYPPLKTIKEITIQSPSVHVISKKNGEQQDFIFIPAETKEYNIQTSGQLDTVIVLSEKVGKRTYRVAADDNSGTDKNALITTKLSKGKTYVIRIKVYYKKGKQTRLNIS